MYKYVILVNKVAKGHWGQKLGAVTGCCLKSGKFMFGKHGFNQCCNGISKVNCIAPLSLTSYLLSCE